MSQEEYIREIKLLMDFFQFTHLPLHLQVISQPFCELAEKMATLLPDNAQKLTCLWDLLKAKDCAVRAMGFPKR